MNTIKIRVLNVLPNGKFRELYRKSVILTDGVSFPFSDVIRVLKVLYPESDFVAISF